MKSILKYLRVSDLLLITIVIITVGAIATVTDEYKLKTFLGISIGVLAIQRILNAIDN